MTISKQKKYLWPIVILLAGALAFYILKVTKVESKPVAAKEKSWLVSAVAVTFSDQYPIIKTYGEIDSLWQAELTAGVASEVVRIHRSEGMQVKKGELLIELDAAESELHLNQRQAELEEIQAKLETEEIRHRANLSVIPKQKKRLSLARAEVDRLVKLYEKKISTGSLRDQAQDSAQRQAIDLVNLEKAVNEFKARKLELLARIDKAKALRDLALLEVKRTKILAPFDGRIKKLQVAIGRRTRIGDPIISLYDSNAMIIRSQIPDQYLPRLEKQGKATGILDGQTVRAELLNLSAEVDRGQAGVEGIFKITSATDNLQKGRFIEVSLVLPVVTNVISVPLEALYDANKVYRVNNEQRIQSIEVEHIGQHVTEKGQLRLLIKSDKLTEAQQIITTQLPNAIDGLLVKVAEP